MKQLGRSGLVVERICLWCLVIVVIFMGFGQAGAKRWGGGVLKSHQLGGAMQVTKGGTLFIGKAGSRYVILLYCETLLQFLLGIKDFIGYLFSILLLLYVLEVAKAKSATQSVVMILTLNRLFQKNF